MSTTYSSSLTGTRVRVVYIMHPTYAVFFQGLSERLSAYGIDV